MSGRGAPPRTPERWYGDSKSYFALFILIDLPSETVNRLLEGLRVFNSAVVWLAQDDTSTVPEPGGGGTEPPVDPAWRSPFIGKSVADAVAFLNRLPDSAREVIDSRHFIVVDDYYLHKGRGLAKAYRIEGDEKDGSELTWVPGDPGDLMNHVYSYQKGQWEESLDLYRQTGRCLSFGKGLGPITPPPE